MHHDVTACIRAVEARDKRFEGRFFVGVVTTGIYCRPGCPARVPKRENMRFFPSAAAAEAAGFRACLRCRPGAAPGSPAWRGTAAIVGRALRLIAEGTLDAERVDDMAARLGVGERQLRRLFAEHVGVSPSAVARSRRLHFARALIEETRLAMSDVAIAAGFSSQRRLNDAVSAAFKKTPSELRGGRARAADATVAITLRVREPYDWAGIAGFLASRAIPGVEDVEAGVYARTATLGGRAVGIEVRLARADALEVRLRGVPARELFAAVERVSRLFDVNADTLAIADALGATAELARLVRARPGLRVPGAWDGFEIAVRAVLGQQISVARASALAGRLVEAFGAPLAEPWGRLTHLFPAPHVLADAEIEKVGMPRARAEAVRSVARAALRGELDANAASGLEAALTRLEALPGVGPWTANYVAMRALNEPDAFPASDLGLRKALGAGGALASEGEVLRASEAWRPFRAYAAMHLWASLG